MVRAPTGGLRIVMTRVGGGWALAALSGGVLGFLGAAAYLIVARPSSSGRGLVAAKRWMSLCRDASITS
jgi:hypothetical protein